MINISDKKKRKHHFGYLHCRIILPAESPVQYNGLDAMDCWIVDGMGLLCRFPMCGRVLSPTRWAVLARVSGREMNSSVSMVHIISVELETNLREILLRAFSWLKAAATAFTSINPISEGGGTLCPPLRNIALNQVIWGLGPPKLIDFS